MSYRLHDLLSLTATPRDGRFPVKEIFYDPDTWRVRYVALGAEGWFDMREMLIGIEHFDAPDDGQWPVKMSRDDVERAPQWNDAPGSTTHLPPIVVGPFGYTFSPMLMAAQWHETQAEQTAPVPSQGAIEDGAHRVFRMDQASAWIGRDVFRPAGSAGRVRDMVLDRTWILSGMVLEDGAHIPLSRLRHVAEQGHAVID